MRKSDSLRGSLGLLVLEAGWSGPNGSSKNGGRHVRVRTYELTAAENKPAAEERRRQAVTAAVNRILRMV